MWGWKLEHELKKPACNIRNLIFFFSSSNVVKINLDIILDYKCISLRWIYISVSISYYFINPFVPVTMKHKSLKINFKNFLLSAFEKTSFFWKF